jgi:amino acid adenylation domain-containing protein
LERASARPSASVEPPSGPQPGDRRIADVHPLAPLQQGLLFESLASGDPGLYCVQVDCTLAGELDLPCFEEAWRIVLRRHPALRSDFDWEELDEPVQVVHDGLDLEIAFREAGPGELATHCAAEARRGFDLAAAPLQRLALVRTGDREHHLVWTYHHLLLDGWSMALVLEQVFAAYSTLRAGRPVPEVAARPFRDYVAWVRAQSPGAAEATWRLLLAGFSEPTPLPASAGPPPPPTDTAGQGTLRRVLGPGGTAELRAFARRHRLTLATLAQAAWGAVLARAAGEEEAVFGAAASVRPAELSGAEGIVGLLLNTLPVRVRRRGREPLAAWLGRLQAEQLEARRFGFAPLVRIQGWSEVRRGQDLFSSLLVFENQPVRGALAAASGLALEAFRVESPHHYPLSLTVLPGPELLLELRHDRRRIHPAAAAHLLAQVEEALAGFARDGDGPWPALGEVERHRVLHEWSVARARRPGGPDLLHRWIEEKARAIPEAVAVVSADRALSYGELDRRAGDLARRLSDRGAGPGALVAVCLERSELLPVALLAVLKSGSAYLPLDPEHPAAWRQRVLQDAGAALLVREGLCIEELRPGAGGPRPRSPGPEDLAYVIYTSGSTGAPKGVEIPHAAISGFLAALLAEGWIGPGDRLLAVTTPTFDIAALELFLPLAAGGCVLVAPRDSTGDPVRLARLAADLAPTAMQATPSLWGLLLEAGWPGGAGLTALCGGEALSPPLAAALRARSGTLVNLYGPTEATVWALAHRVDGRPGAIPIGRPLAGYAAWVLDRDLQPLPAGAAGALYLGGVGLARGYAGLPDRMAESFVPDPWSGGPGARLYATGDRARLLPGGEIEFLGRSDQQVKIRGARVEPAEVEAALLSLPEIAEAAVIARPGAAGAAHLVAHLVPRPGGGRPSTTDLVERLRGTLPRALIPSAFVWHPALPRTANGKLDRRSLPETGRDRPELRAPWTAPRNELERRLAALWGDILGRDAIGVHDDFFELGGDSILAFQVVSRARSAGLRIEARTLFAHRTIAEVAAEASPAPGLEPAAEDPAGGDPAPPVEIEDVLPLAPVQEGMLFHSRLAPGAAIYFEQLSSLLSGPFEPLRFAAAWRSVVARHPILRSAFEWDGAAGGRRRVFRRVELPWSFEDWRGVEPAEQSARLARRLAADRAADFDPSRPPLLRHTVIRLEEQRHRWIWSFHHALLDGWSLMLVAREAFAVYAALGRGEEPALPEPPSEREHLAWIGRRDRALAETFWRRYLAGWSSPTPLPGLTARSPAPAGAASPADRARERRFGREEAEEIAAAARRRGLTLATLVQGAWAILLARYAGLDEVVFGVTSAGRPAELPGAEAMVGLFVSTLPARVEVPPGAPAAAWLARLQESQAEVRRFEACSLTEIQGWSEVPRGTPLFSSVVTLESYPFTDLSAPAPGGLAVGGLGLFERTHDPLSLVAIPRDGLVLRLLADPGRIEGVTAIRLAGQAGALIQALARGEGSLQDLPMLSAAERQQLAVEAWRPAPPLAAPSVLDLVADQAARQPGATAVAAPGRSISYGELWRLSDRLSTLLAERGAGREEIVALALPAGPELALGALAALKSGAAYLPLDPQLPPRRLGLLLRDAGARVLLGRADHGSRLAQHDVPFLGLDEWLTDAAREAPESSAPPALPGALRGALPGRPPDPQRLAYVIYTSGSTGQPKGVGCTHGGLLHLIAWHLGAYAPRAGERVSLLANPGFDAAVWELWPHLAAGSCLCVPPEEIRTDPRALVAWIAREDIAVSFLPTPLAEAALEEPWPPAKLRLLLTGGDRLRRSPAALPFSFVNHYGPTEATVVATAAEVSAGSDPGTAPPIGWPVAGLRAYLLDPWLEPVPSGAPGEIVLAGPGIARGYLGRPAATAESFLPDPFGGEPGARMYRTGDRARRRANGALEFLGRLDRQIQVRGVRIEPAEIEAALLRHPEVAAAVVEDSPGRGLVAWFVPRAPAPGSRDAEEQIDRWRELYDATYGEAADPADPADPALDLVGWASSATGEPIPEAEMREWADRTAERILALRPRRVLEIGCGTGLLLFRLVPFCERYCGTDFSAAALERLRRRLAGPGAPACAPVLLERPADDFQGLEEEGFDLVVLNSVAQYFPDLSYLKRVVEGAVRSVRDGGCVFVGDVRSLPLLGAFHASVELARAPAGLPPEEIRERALRAAAEEEELVVDPRFFTGLSGVRDVEILLKRGRAANELVRFRYDVVLRIGEEPPAAPAAPWLDWRDGGLDALGLRRLLRQAPAAGLGIAGIPNARVLGVAAFAGSGGGADAPGLDPEEVWEMGEAAGLAVSIGWSEDPARFDACFHIPGAPRPRRPSSPAPRPAGHLLANQPLAARRGRELPGRLAEWLRRELPRPLVPTAYVRLRELPLTAHGKIDRRALPAPETPGAGRRASAPLRTELERSVAAIWGEVLGAVPGGADDDFFELGGHSLLATRLVARLRERFRVELPLRAVFVEPTVAGMAARLAAGLAAGLPPAALAPAAAGPPARAEIDRGSFPLLPAQRAHWLARRAAEEGEGEAANVCGEVEAADDGTLAARLGRALGHLVARHEALRLVVTPEGEQRVLPRVPPLPLPVLDLRGVPDAPAGEALDRLRLFLRRRVGPADRWPLFDFVACLLAGRLRLLVRFDALLMDGASRKILLRELFQLAADAEARLEPLAIALRHCVPDPAEPTAERQRARAYWQERAPELPPPPHLPRTGTGSADWIDRQGVLLAPGAWRALCERCASSGLTRSALTLAAFARAFAACGAGPAFTLGVVTSDRPRLAPQAERIAGNFTDLLLLAVEPRGDSFEEEARQIQESLFTALDHRAVSGLELWSGLAGGAASWPPVLFTSLLDFTTGGEETAPGGADWRWIHAAACLPSALVAATVAEGEQGELVYLFQTRDGSLAPGFAERFLSAFESSLERIAAAYLPPRRRS